LKATKAASAEPADRKISLRRGSIASLPSSSARVSSPAIESASTGRRRGGRRPAPGLVRPDEDGSTKIVVGRRAGKPKKGEKQMPEQILTDVLEPIDPDEPRYCVCNDVSWGTMIACDNDDEEENWQGIADEFYSAKGSGSISRASVCTSCLPDERSGIVRIAGGG
ncbi:hypothetical protein LTR28_004389, partial [Elasticomyces elasticus]